MEKIPVRQINTTLGEQALPGSFSIRDVRTLLLGKDMLQEFHRHNYFYVLALEKGVGEHNIDFISYPITNHSVFFMRPGQVHQLRLKSESTGYLMVFGNDFYSPMEKQANELLRKVSSKNYCQLHADRFNSLYSILTYIFKEFSARQYRYTEIIKANLDIFFIELIRQSQNSHSLSTDSSQYAQERLEELLELIELHLSAHKQVGYYAEKLNVSSYQVNAITKLTLGKTCSELIDERVILEAKRYLLATSNQVNQIAYNLGYEDVSYFIRFFKKHTGYSPESFRHNFK